MGTLLLMMGYLKGRYTGVRQLSNCKCSLTSWKLQTVTPKNGVGREGVMVKMPWKPTTKGDRVCRAAGMMEHVTLNIFSFLALKKAFILQTA